MLTRKPMLTDSSTAELLPMAAIGVHAAVQHCTRGKPTRKRRVQLFVAAFALLNLLTVPSTLGEEKLVVLAEDDAAPWSFKDGTGYANDLVKAAFAAAGVAVELEVVPYQRGKQMVIKGTGVACFSMSWLPEYDGKVVFSDKPLFTCYADYFQSIDKPLAAKSQEDIAAKIVVGVVVGYEYPPALTSLRDKGVVLLEESPSEVLNLMKLAAGRIDAALTNTNKIKPAEFLASKAKVTGRVEKAFRCGELNSFIGFSRAHPRGAWAQGKFNEGWQVIEKNGTLRKIEESWIAKMDMEPSASPRTKELQDPPPGSRHANRND